MKPVLVGLTVLVFCGVFGVLNPVKLDADQLRFEHLDAARTPPRILEAGASQSKAEEVHSAVVDVPKVADLSHASPDTWHSLPPPGVLPLNPCRALKGAKHRRITRPS
jgi:hypothetical protein